MKTLKNEGGFTLIELVVVIIVLGVLAAIAVPKYMDIRAEAEQGVATGVTGALRGAIAIAHAKYLMANANTYTATTIVGNLETEDVTVTRESATSIKALFDSGNSYFWAYADTSITDDLPARVTKGW